jgi:AKAP7 2'5' RNA ligase-like domain
LHIAIYGFSDLVHRKGLNSKYHLTVLNSKFLDQSVRRIVTTFDATRLLDKYRDYAFGEMIVDELHLSTLGTRDENGFYDSIAKVTI